MKLLREFTGWTWEYVDETMTIPRFNAVMREFDKYPPIYLSVAALAGIDLSNVESSKEDKEKSNEEKVNELISLGVFPLLG